MKIHGSSPKRDQRGPTRQAEGSLARPPRALGTLLDAWWPTLVPHLAYITPWGKNPRTGGVSEFCHRLVEETYREEKSISGRQIPPGRSPPGKGDRRHPHHHRRGYH